MTVSTTTSRVDYTGNGSTTNFTIPFYIIDASHITVIKTVISTGVSTTLTLSTDYTVTGVGGSSSTLVMTAAPLSDNKISILRNVPLTQTVDYQANDPFPAQTHEGALDKLTMIVQQINEALSRSVLVPASTTGVSTSLPTPTANAIVGWNSTATALTNIDPASWAGTLASEYTYSQTFSGNGSQTTFTLSSAPGAASNCDVYVSGVHQTSGLAYYLSGTSVVFTSAPPAGTNNIEVKWNTVMGQAAVQVLANAAASSATAAAASASSASASVTSASSSASTASTAATNAANSASTASTAATNASNSATNASNSAGAASTSATNAATSASNAAASAVSAASSATSAQGYLAPATSTSSSSVTIGTGSKSFTIETGKPWVAGMPIKLAVTASPASNYMTGTVNSYNSGTGALVVDVTAVTGSGTYIGWSISLQGGSSGGGGGTGNVPVGYVSQMNESALYSYPSGLGLSPTYMRSGFYTPYNSTYHDYASLALCGVRPMNYLTKGSSFAPYSLGQVSSKAGVGFCAIQLNNAVFSALADFGSVTQTALGFTPYGIACDGSNFVVVGSGGNIRYSSNGTSWFTATSPTANNLYAICWTGTYFIAVGASGVIIYSTNGSSWSSATSGSLGHLYAVASNGTTYVAAGEAGIQYATTTPATWTYSAIASGALYGVAYGAGKWYVRGTVSGQGQWLWATTPSGSWLGSNSIITSPSFLYQNLIVCNGNLCAVGGLPMGTYTKYVLISSSDPSTLIDGIVSDPMCGTPTGISTGNTGSIWIGSNGGTNGAWIQLQYGQPNFGGAPTYVSAGSNENASTPYTYIRTK